MDRVGADRGDDLARPIQRGDEDLTGKLLDHPVAGADQNET